MKKSRFYTIIILLSLLICVIDSLIEPGQIFVNAVTVPIPVKYAALDGVKILQISDIHLKGRLGSSEFKIIDWAKQYHPDIIAITGDFVEQKELWPVFVDFMNRLPDAHKFAVFGNWERWLLTDEDEWEKKFLKKGVHLLINERRTVEIKNTPVVVAGIDDLYSGHADLPRVLKGCPSGYRILLSHSPAAFSLPEFSEFALTLSGHCHKGQIRLPWLGALCLPRGCEEYEYGLYQKGQSFLYVTAGSGWSGLPMRFLARPEIALIELKSEKPSSDRVAPELPVKADQPVYQSQPAVSVGAAAVSTEVKSTPDENKETIKPASFVTIETTKPQPSQSPNYPKPTEFAKSSVKS